MSETQRQRITDLLTAFGQAIESTGTLGRDLQLAYWHQLAESIAAHANATDPSFGQGFGNIRDIQMARNLLWLPVGDTPRGS